MADIQDLVSHFTAGIRPQLQRERWVGSEIETFFLGTDGTPITIGQSQGIMAALVARGWDIASRKGGMITEVRKGDAKILYELGYPNVELSVGPASKGEIVAKSRAWLDELYACAAEVGAYPVFEPIFEGSGNYLAIPDERDLAWLALDGKEALTPLARISAVQFTFDVKPVEAVEVLNRLGSARGEFLRNYPQDRIWRDYIRLSRAAHESTRYGGPARINDIRHYCELLAAHAVVIGTELKPLQEAALDTPEAIDLFLRSIWWYFRLRRYGDNLCVEVRPLPRRDDDMLQGQLDLVWDIAFG